MKKFLNLLFKFIFGFFIFLFGFLCRQPKINNLVKNNKKLIITVDELIKFNKKKSDDFKNLLAQHNALKAWNFTERNKLDTKIKENLVLQYASKEYNDLSDKINNQNYNINEDESLFLSGYKKLISNGDISEKEMESIYKHIMNKYENEVNNFIVCDVGKSSTIPA